jgi:hypothetical protein
MRVSVLLLCLRAASASHASFACRDEAFPAFGGPGGPGCIVAGPSNTTPPLVGILVYGAAGTPEAASIATVDGEGTMACTLVQGGSYGFLPSRLIPVRPYMTCADLDDASSDFNGVGNNGGTFFPERGIRYGETWRYLGARTLTPPPAAGESLGDACRRMAAELLPVAQSMEGLDGSASTGLPFLGSCPRVGGYLERGGTAEGYESFQKKQLDSLGTPCHDWCNYWTCGLMSSCSGCTADLGGYTFLGVLPAPRWGFNGCKMDDEEECRPWCNRYTRGSSHCAGCAAPSICAAWCNSWTCGASAWSPGFFADHCGACDFCGA